MSKKAKKSLWTSDLYEKWEEAEWRKGAARAKRHAQTLGPPQSGADRERELQEQELRAHRLLSELVSRCCSGMDEGDRFYHSSDDTWWTWIDGRLRSSGPPPGYLAVVAKKKKKTKKAKKR